MSNASSVDFFGRALEVLRGELRTDESILLLGRLLAWMVVRDKLPRELQMPDELSAGDLRRYWVDLADNKALGDCRWAFAGAEGFPYAGLSSQTLNSALSHVVAAVLVDLDKWAIANWLISQSNAGIGYLRAELAPDLAEFATSLLNAKPGDRVLVPTHLGDAVACAAMRIEVIPVIVSPVPPVLAAIVAAFTRSRMEYRQADPYTTDLGQTAAQSEMAYGIIIPPFGMRREKPLWSEFGALSSESRAVELALRHVREVSVVQVPMSFLTARSAPERAIREHLVKSGRLEAVVAFPSGAMKGTTLPFAFLVIVSGRIDPVVTFCSVAKQDFSSPKGKLRSSVRRFTGAQRIVELLHAPDGKVAIEVTKAQIDGSDYDLSPVRYLHAGMIRFMDHIDDLVALGELVEIVKPQHLPDSESDGAISVREISPSEAPEFGPITDADRTRDVDEASWKSKQSQALQKGDVLLSVKGVIGKVAVVGDIKNSVVPIVPSLSYVILRPSRLSKIVEPAFLAMYLRSPIVQKELEARGGEGTIPNIRLQDLRAMQIWLPSLEQQGEWQSAFARQTELEDGIRHSRQEQADITKQLWARHGLAD